MRSNKRLVSCALGAATILLLTGCAQAVPAGNAKGESSAATKPAQADAPDAKPFNSSGLLAGNATPTFPAGEPGKVSVVAQGPLDKTELGATMPIAFRNNTTAGISHVDFTVTARAGGKIVAAGQSQGGAVPAQLQPGEVALDYIYFEDPSGFPKTGVTYEFKVETMPADTTSYNTAALKVTEANHNSTSIVGSAVNSTGEELVGPYGVYGYCFAGNNLTGMVQSFANPDADLAPKGQVSFTLDLFDERCPTFTVGASGYFK